MLKWGAAFLCSSVFCVCLAGCAADEVEPVFDGGPPDATARDGASEDAHDAATSPACVNGIWNQNLVAPEVLNVPSARASVRSTARLHASLLDAEAPSDLVGIAARLAQENALATVHLTGTLDAAMRRDLALLGVTVLERLRAGFYIVQLARGANVQALASARGVASLQLLQANDKLLFGLLPLALGERTQVDVVRVNAQHELVTARVTLTRSEALALAAHSDVLRISRVYIMQPLVDIQRMQTHADEVQGFSIVGGLPRYSGLTGRGIVVALNDTGVDAAHPDFHAWSETGEDLGTRVTGATTPPDAGWGHGTVVAGMIGGNGWASDGQESRGTIGTPFLWHGFAPEVDRIVSSRLNENIRPPWISAFVDGHAFVSNHSHTQSGGEYPAPVSSRTSLPQVTKTIVRSTAYTSTSMKCAFWQQKAQARPISFGLSTMMGRALALS
ncbi:MAG: S8 family serine peptidase [Sandaracinaceae bacterium]|nr:S8 family serine peptidase [Sandaracinaceae bacterium]